MRERQPEAFMQDDDQRRSLGSDLHCRGAERVRGLRRMPALHAPSAPRTCPDVEGGTGG